MAQFKEKRFNQMFDIIVKKERLTLDIEKDKYPDEKISFYVNGTTGKTSNSLEDVIQDNRNYIISDIDEMNNERVGYSVEYDDEQEILIFHLLIRNKCSRVSEGAKIEWNEFCRFVITKDHYVYVKRRGYSCKGRGYHSSPSYSRTEKNIDESGEYFLDSLPIDKNNCNILRQYVNMENGSKNGFMKEISNLFPPIVNVTGNDYIPLQSYKNLFDYFKATETLTCVKKSGKKQNIIDELISYQLKELSSPTKDEINVEYIENGVYKFAVIEKVPIPDKDVCVVRTLNYVVEEDFLFEGGRIYVGKKDINFCKKNNEGEYVNQPLLSKIKHWDFYLNKFPEEETKGTKLEYFGNIVQEIEPVNRSVSIWMFLKEPFLESLAKISSADVINELIENIRDCENIETALLRSFGIANTKGKNIFQMLGINKHQFALLKDILPYSMPKSFYDKDSYSLTQGIIPICKCLLKGYYTEDISDIDIKTFEDYLNFAVDLYSFYEMTNNSGKKEYINAIIERICDEVKKTKRIFPTFDIRNLFNIFMEISDASLKHCSSQNSYNAWNVFRFYSDYLRMVERLPDKDEYKPKFKDIEDLQNMHDNIQLMIEYKDSRQLTERFMDRYNVWEKWTFQRDEKKTKEGVIKQEGLPFIVIYPKKPIDLAREGTKLHHCVKGYIDRVADGVTNIMFIRKKESPEEPFFTVEITNDNHIQQVHGLQNRNADTEEGLEDFLEIWAKAKRLKLDSPNKVRG